MGEISSHQDIQKITDPTERLFASILLRAFPTLTIHHEVTITARSGARVRTTRPDFLLTNADEQDLYIEIASGDKKTGRKSKQHKTMRLAGHGGRYVIFFGSEIEAIASTEESQMRILFLQLLSQRFALDQFEF